MNLKISHRTINPLEKLNSNNLLLELDRFGALNIQNKDFNDAEKLDSSNSEDFLSQKNNQSSSLTNLLNFLSKETKNYFPKEDEYLSNEIQVSDFEHAGVCGCFSCCGSQNDFQNNATEDNSTFENGASFNASNRKWSQPGGLGSPVEITYSYSNLLNGDLNGISSGDVEVAMEEAFGVWSSVAPLNFTEVEDGSNSQIRIGSDFIDGRGNTLAFAFFPTNGDITFDNGERWSESLFLETAVHEIGHSLGLNHESGTDAIMNPSIKNRYNGLGSAFLLQDDINGIRSIYGRGNGSVDPLGDDTPEEPTPEPLPEEPTPEEPTPEPTPEEPTQPDSDFTGTMGDDVLVGNNRDNFIRGLAGNDIIEGGRGNDTLIGNRGNDTLRGGLGNDHLKGKSGADTFTFESLDDGVDIIKDYSLSEGDRIQVSISGFGTGSRKRFSYDSNSGDLFFGDEKFAVLENKPSFNSVASGFVGTT